MASAPFCDPSLNPDVLLPESWHGEVLPFRPRRESHRQMMPYIDGGRLVNACQCISGVYQMQCLGRFRRTLTRGRRSGAAAFRTPCKVILHTSNSAGTREGVPHSADAAGRCRGMYSTTVAHSFRVYRSADPPNTYDEDTACDTSDLLMSPPPRSHGHGFHVRHVTGCLRRCSFSASTLLRRLLYFARVEDLQVRNNHAMAKASLTVALVLAGAALADFPDCLNGPLKDNLVCDPTASHTARARALVDEFTLDELVNNTINTSPGVPRLGLPAYQWWSEALVSAPIVHASSL